MREILFRGKRKDTGEWAYGYFVSQGEETYIFEQAEVDKGIDLGGSLDCCEMREVIPESLGQYIGLTDKNGKKIFEGDVLVSARHIVPINEKIIISYDNASYTYASIRRFFKDCYDPIDDNEYGIYIEEYKIIGNIHDNPELLEVED